MNSSSYLHQMSLRAERSNLGGIINWTRLFLLTFRVWARRLLAMTIMTTKESGQSLLEVIIAMTVGILVVVALVFATVFSLRNAAFAKNSAQATKLAQEGIERVRTGRDRSVPIIGLASTTDCPISGNAVNSWNGDTSGSPIWNCKIYNSYGSGGNAYFKFTGASSNDLNYAGTNTDFPAAPENIPQSIFTRAIILSDDAASYSVQKTVTVIVRWNDFAGAHESKLTTILRKL